MLRHRGGGDHRGSRPRCLGPRGEKGSLSSAEGADLKVASKALRRIRPAATGDPFWKNRGTAGAMPL